MDYNMSFSKFRINCFSENDEIMSSSSISGGFFTVMIFYNSNFNKLNDEKLQLRAFAVGNNQNFQMCCDLIYDHPPS